MMRVIVIVIVNLFLLLICFLILSDGQEDKTGVLVRMERVLCSCGSHYCTFSTCKVQFKSRTVAELTVVCDIRRKVRSLKFTVQMFYKFSNNEYRPLFVDTEIDFCAAQAGMLSSLVHKTIMGAYANFSHNFNRKCPLMPGQYYLKDFNLHALHFPSVFPIGRYLINSTAHAQNNDWLYNTSVYYSVTYHGVKDFSMG